MKLPTLLSILALLGAGGSAVVLHGQNRDLEARLDALASQASAPAPAPDGAPVLSGTRAGPELAALRQTTDALVRRLEAAEEGVRAIRAGARPAAGDDGPHAPGPGTSAFAEAVRGVVLDLAARDVAFRARLGHRDRTKIPKNAPFAQLAEVLQLDASQEAQVAKDLQAIQQELFALLAEERDDGIVPLERIAQAEELGPNDPGRAEIFVQLFTLKIPGAEQTYMERAVQLQKTFREATQRTLRPQQLEIFNALEVDLFSIKFQ